MPPPGDRTVQPPDNQAIELSVVMPCLDEVETLAVCLDRARDFIRAHGLAAEIIVADNGSTDGSPAIAESRGVRVVRVPARGYGAALSGGIAAARGRFIVMGDADESYDFGAILPFLEMLREGCDLVMGCRLPSGGGSIMPGAMPWKHRWVGNPILSALGRLLFRAPVTDFHCGLRAFSKDAFGRMNLRTTGMEFASEMVLKAALLKMRIGQVPITLYRDGRTRPPHLRSWRDGWRHLRFMLMYSPRWLFLAPGALLLLGGALFFGLLIRGPLPVGKVLFDTNTLLVSALSLMLGFQLISFYVFTRVFAVSEGLLPKSPRTDWLTRFFRLEIGLAVGVLITLGGLGFLGRALAGWARIGFGELSYPRSLRQVVPAVTLITLGVQMIFSSFLVSILGLRRR